MLDQMDNQIDAVTVSTPDHMHAIRGVSGDEEKQGCVLSETAHADDL